MNITARKVADRLTGIERPHIRIRFYLDRIQFHVMSKDRIGMSAAWIAVYRRDKWQYNKYLIDQTFAT